MNFPAGQLEHVDAPTRDWYNPKPQTVHDEEPAVEKYPAAHCPSNAVWPLEPPYEPPGASSHDDAVDEAWNFPAEQAAHEEDPAAAEK